VSLRRAIAPVAGLVAVTTLLTGCDKPRPTITVLGNDRATTVPAQPLCTIQAVNPCPVDAGRQRTVSARSGSQLLIDVPAQLADNGYLVSAYTTDGTKNTPVSAPGASSGPITGKLAVKLAVPSQAQGSYFVQVSPLPSKHPSNQLTTWLVLVQLTA
jgi:hypothetical protein